MCHSAMQQAAQTAINHRSWINGLFPIGRLLQHNTIYSALKQKQKSSGGERWSQNRPHSGSKLCTPGRWMGNAASQQPRQDQCSCSSALKEGDPAAHTLKRQLIQNHCMCEHCSSDFLSAQICYRSYPRAHLLLD